MMKFLICGMGSIGQRHTRILKKLIGDEAEIAAYRSRKLDIVISDTLEAKQGVNPEEFYNIRSFTDFVAALEWKPDAVFVTNPISMHVSTAIAAARAGSHIFIEKPLAHSMDGVKELQEIVKEKKLVCMIGYQLRFHPAYKKIHSLIEKQILGDIVMADLHFGEWLPGMHPYEDYRDSHAARSDQGGGAILCLSHELDIAYWLFGQPKSIYAAGGHLSSLEMDVEDTADITLLCEGNSSSFPVHIHLDFLQKPAHRYIHIVGDKGKIHFDYYTNDLRISLLPEGKEEVVSYSDFRRNDMFEDELQSFIDSIKMGTPPPVPLEDGLAVLQVALNARASLTAE